MEKFTKKIWPWNGDLVIGTLKTSAEWSEFLIAKRSNKRCAL